MTRLMMRLTLVFAVSMLSTHAVARCGVPHTIILQTGADTGGGNLADREARVNAAIRCNDRVRIENVCVSACTQWLRMPADRICATTNAPFVFHHVADMQTGRAMPIETRRMFAAFPERVRRAITAQGGLSARFIYVPAHEIVRRCD